MRRTRKERGHYGSRYNRMRSEMLVGVPECYLCGQAVDITLDWRHPGAPQIHLITPITKGGSWHDRNNCRVAHRLCNIRQSNHDDGTVDHGTAIVRQGWIVADEP